MKTQEAQRLLSTVYCQYNGLNSSVKHFLQVCATFFGADFLCGVEVSDGR